MEAYKETGKFPEPASIGGAKDLMKPQQQNKKEAPATSEPHAPPAAARPAA